VLVFFDDILIYSHTWAKHLVHLHLVLETLREHKLFLKQSKCSFGTNSVSYLGHVISSSGVDMDKDKVQAVVDWPAPSSVRALREFLGLAGYYRKFIKDFGVLAAPLTQLLKKEGFSWSDEANNAFLLLKKALTTAPVLHLPDFNNTCIVECDASGSSFGVVLHQGKGAIAFFSKTTTRHHALAAYERELIGLIHAVRHWRPYLWGRTFIIRTDHYGLKFLLDQRLATIPQHHWVSKLLGFNFSVEYKPGRTNVVADALSCRDIEQGVVHTLSSPNFDIMASIRKANIFDLALVALKDQITAGMLGEPWALTDGLVTF
jgi:hypothetical protein